MDGISQGSHGKISEDDTSAGADVPAWMSPHGYPQVCENSSTPAAFARASEWLSYCVEHDKDCTPPNDFWPRRLVNVNLGDEAKDPFLVKPTGPMTYACLSYCWGPNADKVLRTTKDNIDEYFSAIPFDSMPKSLQDAVEVCRRLNIPYLWVDSLCIQQDDDDEWLRESAKMDSTYFNSHLTIAALEPASCESGFLGQQLFSNPGQRPDFEKLKSGHHWTEGNFSLNRRGWCLQEEILPNRRLCFNGAEMSWECLCRRTCKCGHQLWPSRNRRTLSDELDFAELGGFLKKPNLTVACKQRAKVEYELGGTSGRKYGWLLGGYSQGYSDTMSKTREVWRHLVTRYSRRALSYRRDKLAAVAGLAKMTRDAIYREDDSRDEYLAGLWKKEIHFDLAWYIERPVARLPDPVGHDDIQGVFCAPSWSWASSDSSVLYECSRSLWDWVEDPEAIERCEFIAAECGGSTGPLLRGGRIRLQGALAAVEVGMLETEEGSTELENRLGDGFPDFWVGPRPVIGNVLVRAQNLCSIAAIMDYPIDPNVKLDDNRRDCWLKGKCEKGCCSWDNNEQAQFYCFRLFSWYCWMNTPMGRETWFLLLEKSSNGVFRRIGAGRQEFGHGWSYDKIAERGFSGWLFEGAEEEIVDII